MTGPRITAMPPDAAPHWRPIDHQARNGASQIVRNGRHFALARFRSGVWRQAALPIPLDFEPTEYHR